MHNIFEDLSAVGAFEATAAINPSPFDELVPIDNSIEMSPKALDTAPSPEFEEEEDYDPAQQAENIANLIAVGNIVLTTPLYRWKLRKNYGGKENIQRCRAAYELAEFSEKELTEKEARQKSQYLAYLADKKEWESSVPYSAAEIDQLKTFAVPFMEETKMKIGASTAFWGYLLSLQAGKILKILE